MLSMFSSRDLFSLLKLTSEVVVQKTVKRKSDVVVDHVVDHVANKK